MNDSCFNGATSYDVDVTAIPLNPYGPVSDSFFANPLVVVYEIHEIKPLVPETR